ncbi:beta-lactamase/transpeptidase-like protein [Aspergillus karnatakaensis]|uniref:serine hydrolase domain-containing protein n=1 Tax=Aspergillus karnatakaensis TaxID=1810916 RepID=UPI003CCD3079
MHFLSFVACVCLFATSFAQLPLAPELIADPSYSGCPPGGPLLPRPTDLAHSKYIHDAGKDLTAKLDAAIQGEISAGWTVENVSFSLALVSPYGASGVEDNVVPFWEYHHRGKNNVQGVSQVDGDTQYMIGSVSKVFSDLMLLKSGVDLRTPVTDYLPQLRSKRSKIGWEDITLEMLADHLAGIPPNAFYEFYFLNSFHESLGLPHLDDSQYPGCGVLGLNNGCTREQIIEGLLSKEQIVPFNSRPVYSQLSFTIFALCLESHTGKSYSQLLDETIYNPLSLESSGVSPGNTDRAAVPPGISGWGSDYGFNAPGGGLYSTTNDLSAFLSSILNKRILDTPADVRAWLKPQSTTSSLNTLVGRPWEILRTTDLLPHDYVHTVDIYAKSGGAMGYMAQIGVIDQYGIGIAVLTAGPVDAMDILYRAALGTFVPAVDEEVRYQSRRLTGAWTSKSINRTHDHNYSATSIDLKLELDDGPGLKLTSYTRDNSSIINAIKTIWDTEYLALGFGILPEELRIYPTDLEIPVPAAEASAILAGLSSSTHHKPYTRRCNDSEPEVQLIRQQWRINLDIIPIGGDIVSDLPGQKVATNYCGSWQTVDWMTYGGIGLDKIVAVIDKVSGKVIGLEVPALRGGFLTR